MGCLQTLAGLRSFAKQRLHPPLPPPWLAFLSCAPKQPPHPCRRTAASPCSCCQSILKGREASHCALHHTGSHEAPLATSIAGQLMCNGRPFDFVDTALFPGYLNCTMQPRAFSAVMGALSWLSHCHEPCPAALILHPADPASAWTAG